MTNPFDHLQLDEPPFALSPDLLLAQGRRQVRRRRLLALTTSTTVAVTGAAVAVALLPGSASQTSKVVTITPVASSTASTGLTADNLVAAVEDAIGGPLLAHDPVVTNPPNHPELRLLLHASIKGTSFWVAVGKGAPATDCPPSATGAPTSSEACGQESLPGGATLHKTGGTSDLKTGSTTTGSRVEYEDGYVAPDGEYVTLDTTNETYVPGAEDTSTLQPEPALTPATLRKATIALGQHLS